MKQTSLQAENIFRYTDRAESVFIPPENCAVMINDMLPDIVEGYGAYLLDTRDPAVQPEHFMVANEVGPIIRIDEDIADGTFIALTSSDDPSISVLGSADIPDRTLFLTGLCNSNCIMCPYTTKHRCNESSESLDVLQRFVHLMDPFAQYLCVTGGEPTLLRQDFLILMGDIRDYFEDCLVHVLTNGRIFYYSDFLHDFQRVRPGRTLLGIPVYGHNAQIHDNITQTPGSFEQTMMGLQRLYGAGEHIEIRIVVSALNYEWLIETAMMIIKLFPKVYGVSIMGLEMMGNAMLNRSKVWIGFDEARESITKCVDLLIENGVQVQLYNYPLCKVDRRHWPIYRKSITPSKVEYLPACDECAMRQRCGGFFATTIHMPDITVVPFTKEQL